MKRNICLLTILSALSCICLSAFFINKEPFISRFVAKSQNSPYQLTFSPEDDLIEETYYHQGWFSKNSVFNNEISFSYHGLKYSENNFATMYDGGFIFNRTPLNGLREISVLTDNLDSSFKLYYTNNANPNPYNTFYNYVELNQANNFTFTFMNSYKHFKLVSDSADMNLTKLTISYECAEIVNIFNDFLLTYVNEGFWVVSGTHNKEIEYVNIPSYYKGMPIKGICDYAFSGCFNIKKVYIPETFEYLFTSSSPRSSEDATPIEGLHRIFVPANENDCKNFEGYEVHPSNKILYSEDGVLYNKEQTLLIGVPGTYKGVFTIKEGVLRSTMNTFLGCDKITKIIIPNSFANLTSNYSAFGFNTSLAEFEVRENNNFFKTVGGILYNKDMTQLVMVPSAMTGKYDIPNTVKIINMFAFYFSQLSEVTIPNSVIDIMPYTFSYASNIEYIEIPDSVLTVGWFAFGACTSLKEVVFGDSITRLESSMFYNCPNLQKITLGKNIDYYDLSYLSIDHELEEIVVKSPCLANISIEDCIEYQNGYYYSFNENPYQCFVDVVDKNVKSIATHNDCEYVLTNFDGCNELESIVYGKNVLKSKTIINCPSLTSIEIPSTILLDKELVHSTSVPNLENVYFNGTINDWCKLEISSETVNPKSYANNIYLKDNNGNYYVPTTVEVPEGISKIDYHFANWDQLQSLVLNDSISHISNFECNENVYNIYNGAKYLGSKNSDYAYLVDGHNGTGNFISSDCIGIADNACDSMTLSEDIDLSKIKYLGVEAFQNTSFTNTSIELASIVHISGYAFRDSNVEKFVVSSTKCSSVAEWAFGSTVAFEIIVNGANDISNWSLYFFVGSLDNISYF